jgi:hypothetical protein
MVPQAPDTLYPAFPFTQPPRKVTEKCKCDASGTGASAPVHGVSRERLDKYPTALDSLPSLKVEDRHVGVDEIVALAEQRHS